MAKIKLKLTKGKIAMKFKVKKGSVIFRGKTFLEGEVINNIDETSGKGLEAAGVGEFDTETGTLNISVKSKDAEETTSEATSKATEDAKQDAGATTSEETEEAATKEPEATKEVTDETAAASSGEETEKVETEATAENKETKETEAAVQETEATAPSDEAKETTEEKEVEEDESYTQEYLDNLKKAQLLEIANNEFSLNLDKNTKNADLRTAILTAQEAKENTDKTE